ncbi:MAG: hypothetical protein WCJ40_10515, partial [Planctomycetota bacterium]
FKCRHGPLTGLARSGGLAIILLIFIRRFCGSCAPDEGIGPSLIWRFFGCARPMRASGRHLRVYPADFADEIKGGRQGFAVPPLGGRQAVRALLRRRAR